MKENKRKYNGVKCGLYSYAETVLQNQLESPLSFETYLSQLPFLIFALRNLPELPLEVSLLSVDHLCASVASESIYYRTIFAMLRGNHIPLCFPDTDDTKTFSQVDLVCALQLLLFCDQDLTELDVYHQLVRKDNLVGFEEATGATRALYLQLKSQCYSKCQLMDLLISLVERLESFKDLSANDCFVFSSTAISTNMGVSQKDMPDLRYVFLEAMSVRLFDKKFTKKFSDSSLHVRRFSCNRLEGVYFDFGDHGGQPYIQVMETDPAKLKVIEAAIDVAVVGMMECLRSMQT